MPTRTGRTLAGLLLLGSLSAWAGANPELDKAAQLFDELNYKQAAPLLDAAWKRSGNDRAQVLKILELQGLVAATLNNAAKATGYFQQLLSLDPEHKLSGDYPPRVMTPYYEARGRVSDKGALEFKAGKAALVGGRVIQLAVDVSDPTKLAKRVRFHLRPDGGPWSDATVELAGKHAAMSTDAKRVEWWAELLSDNEAVLALAGDVGAPLQEGQAELPVVAAPIPPPPPPPVEEHQAGGGSWPAGRWAGVGVAAAGVAGVAVGVVEGLQANSLRNQVNNATLDASGHVNGLTQAKAYQLDSEQRTAALVANICLVGGGVLAAAGVTLFAVSGPGETKVALVPMGAGAGLSGSF